jgi:flagella basal body P-ring formation protein FlgA
MFKALSVLLFLNFILSNVAIAASHDARIKSYSSISKNTLVQLIDIIEFDNDEQAQQFRDVNIVVIDDALRLGEKRVFSNKAIAELIRKNPKSKNWNFKIPHRVIIENKGYQISYEAVEAALLNSWKPICNLDCEIKVTALQLPIIPNQYHGRPWSLQYDGRNPKGYLQAQIKFINEDQTPTFFWVTGKTQMRKKMPVLKQAMASLRRINKDDIQMEWRDVTFATDSTPTVEDIVGQQLRFALNSGDIIWSNSLIKEKAVKRGQNVRVFLTDPSWEVAIQAITEQDGYVGDIVNLRNLTTNKIISGRVVGNGEVEIQ